VRRALVLALVALGLAGCGLGSGEAPSGGAELTVSRNFGAEELGHAKVKSIPGGETVMRQLQRKFEIQTRYGGGFVQEIDGIAGGRRSGRPVDWFYYVNGIESESGAAARRLRPGDRVWWDHHDWGGAMRVPAVVGSFPEPFRSGTAGKRLPVRVECATDQRRSCDEVRKRLEAADVRVSGSGTLGTPAGKGVLRVLVGRWQDLRVDPAARRIEAGPKVSGVFARPSGDGRHIALLDPRGVQVRSLGGSAGLVAATRFVDQQPTWIVTGTDDVGVAAAAAALVEERLKEHFAVALEMGREVPVPLPAGGAAP
jgi:hypothetical protein